VAKALAEDPVLFAGGGTNNDFHVIYARLSSNQLLLGQERPASSRFFPILHSEDIGYDEKLTKAWENRLKK